MCIRDSFFDTKRVPVGWLTMGGSNPDFGGEGGWGMHTQLVNSLGEVSLSGQELLRFLGKPQYDGDIVDPPEEPPSNGGDMEPGFEPYVNMLVRSLKILLDGDDHPIKRLLEDEEVQKKYKRFKKGVNK